MIKEISEQRKWPRHRIKIPLSLQYSDTRSLSRTWHVGETRDVSVEGMQIVSSSLKALPLLSRLEILCFPEQAGGGSYFPDPEPVSMTGVVMWQDIQDQRTGIRLES